MKAMIKPPPPRHIWFYNGHRYFTACGAMSLSYAPETKGRMCKNCRRVYSAAKKKEEKDAALAKAADEWGRKFEALAEKR